jgi:hypothetical protein
MLNIFCWFSHVWVNLSISLSWRLSSLCLKFFKICSFELNLTWKLVILLCSLRWVFQFWYFSGWLGGWGGSENTANLAKLELELGLSLAKRWQRTETARTKMNVSYFLLEVRCQFTVHMSLVPHHMSNEKLIHFWLGWAHVIYQIWHKVCYVDVES